MELPNIQERSYPSKELLVKDFLCQKNVGGVSSTSGKGCIGHDDDDCVLLHVEWPRNKVEFAPEELPLPIREYLRSKVSKIAFVLFEILILPCPNHSQADTQPTG